MIARRSSWIVAGGSVVAFVIAWILYPGVDASANALFFGVATSLVLVGALLRTRVPGNRVGTMLLIAGVMQSTGMVLATYSLLGAQSDPAWPGTAVAGVLIDVFFIYPIVIVLIGVPLVFPDGRLPSPRFRWIAGLTVAAMAALTLADLFLPDKAGLTGLPNPLVMPALAPIFDLFKTFANLSAVIGFGGAATALWVRSRRGGPIVREQLKWLVAVAGVATIAFPAAFLLQPSEPTQPSPLTDALFILGFLAVLALPCAIGVAILRYRLYEIDRIISRTISYALVTGALATVFVVAVIALEGLLSGITEGQTLAVAASTLLAFALFQPLRRRIQGGVDRRFDRVRYDGQLMAEAFGGRLRSEVDIAAVTGDLDSTIRAAVRPSTVQLWVRGPR